MPLQVRRGTEAERLAMTQKLADGELLWITDDKKLYVGDGVTSSPSLAPVTGFNTENAQDAAASMITAATHSGINFIYDDLAGTLTASVDLSNYSGVIEADAFVGSVFADNSTLLVDGVAGRIVGPVFANVTGNVTGNLTGNVTGNVTGNISGNVTGDVTGTVTGNVTGNLTGYHLGDVKGSVFGDDSSPLVDAVDRIFYGTIDTGSTIIDTDSLIGSTFNLGTTTSLLNLNLNLDNNLQVRQISDPVNGRYLTFSQNRGTLAAPAAVQPGDLLGGVLVRAYTSPTNSAIAGFLTFQIDPTSTIPSGSSFVKSKAFIGASSDTNNTFGLTVDSDGRVDAAGIVGNSYIQTAVYANDAARLAAIPTPVQGMMVFMQSGTVPTVTNKAVVYDGSAWVALH